MKSVVMIGATGAVGSRAVGRLLQSRSLERLTLLGRRPLADINDHRVHQHKIDILDPSTYRELISGHDTAICTVGIGQPSKVSKETFLKIDKEAVLSFGTECREAGVLHFELLSSVGIDADSRSFFLRAKGELVVALSHLTFERLSIFQPSMIITPTNRYGVLQAITLAVWPVIDKLFVSGWRKYKGINVSDLGVSMANNVFSEGAGEQYFHYDQIMNLVD